MRSQLELVTSGCHRWFALPCVTSMANGTSPFHTKRLLAMLQAPATQARFGFLYKGYTYIYFEVWDMLRKLCIAGIPALVPTQPFGSTQVGPAQINTAPLQGTCWHGASVLHSAPRYATTPLCCHLSYVATACIHVLAIVAMVWSIYVYGSSGRAAGPRTMVRPFGQLTARTFTCGDHGATE